MEYTIYIKGMYDNRAGVGAAAWVCGDKEEVEPIAQGQRQVQVENFSSGSCVDLEKNKEHFQLELYALYCAISNGTNYWEDDFIVVSNNTAVVSWINGCHLKAAGHNSDGPYASLLGTIVALLEHCNTKSLKAVHVKKNDSSFGNVRVNTIAQKALNEEVMGYYSGLSKNL